MLHAGGQAAQPGLLDDEVLGVLAYHVVPHLQLLTVQALGQTCTQLRQVVRNDIPAASWRASCARSLHRDHPLLSTDSAHLPAALSQLAAVHGCVRSGRLQAFGTDLCLRHALVYRCSALSPLGTHFLAIDDGGMTLRSRTAPLGSFDQAFWLSTPPHPQFWGSCHYTLTWAPDESFLAVHCSHPACRDGLDFSYVVQNYEVPAVWDLMYLLNVSTQDLVLVAQTPEYDHALKASVLQEPVFSHDGQILLIGAYVNDSVTEMRILSRNASGWECTAVGAEPFLLPNDSCFSPDNHYIASGSEHALVITSANDLIELQCIRDGAPMAYSACKFSSNGALLACYRDTYTLQVFDCKNWRHTASIDLIAQACGSFFLGLTHLALKSSKPDGSHELSIAPLPTLAYFESMDPYEVYENGTLCIPPWSWHRHQVTPAEGCLQNTYSHEEVALCAFSPDGAFIATGGPGLQVSIVHCRTGACMLRHVFDTSAFQVQGLEAGSISAGMQELTWLPSSAAILAHFEMHVRHGAFGLVDNGGQHVWDAVFRLELCQES